MKDIAPDLLAHYLAAGDTICDAVRIERRDGTVYTLTAHDRNVVLDVGSGDETYLCTPGYELSQLVSTAGLAVDNADFRFLADNAFFNRADMLAGLLNGASALLLQYAWKDPAAGVHILKAGWLGNLKPRRAEFVAEFRDLRQPLQFNTTWVTQATCRNRLGDSRCGVDLEPFTFADEVTALGSSYAFTAAGLTQDADYFGNGVLTWLTGANASIEAKVRSFEAGVVTFLLPMLFPIVEGDTFSIVAGCRKRHEHSGTSDCRDKFDNLLNFNGEPSDDKPSPDEALNPQTEVLA
jgi:uncharacterized phage protein (TIGR02218 family)